MKNRSKYVLISLVLCAILLACISSDQLPVWLAMPESHSNAQVEPLSTALAVTGARLHDFSINGWSELASKELSDDELTDLVEMAMRKLGIDGSNYKVTHNSSPRHRLVRAEARGDQFHAVAIAQVMHSTQENSALPEVYLVLNIEAVSDFGPIDQWWQKVNTIIRQSGGQPRISTCLTGWFDGKLEQDERGKLLTKAYTALDGIIHDKIHYVNFSSFSGYSPKIADWLQVGDKRTNVNMAMRYSPYDNRTYILVGSPVITREH